ncbi:MAG: hypothetical protein IJZ17_02830 [Muribaculaceae bacterium]|nr:hypothetical protein [Muribaculaceae bacterium]
MGSKKPNSYQWQIFIPLAALLWGTIITLAIFQYQREKSFRAQNFNTELMLINSRILAAYDKDINIEPFLNFVTKYYEGTALRGIRVSIYDNETRALLYCAGAPIPYDLDFNPRQSTLTSASLLHSDEHAPDTLNYYFHRASPSSDNGIVVHTAMPYTPSLNEALSVDYRLWIVIIVLASIATTIAFLSSRYLAKNVNGLHRFIKQVISGQRIDYYATKTFANDELGNISRKIIDIYRDSMGASEDTKHKQGLATQSSTNILQMTNNIGHELKTPVGVIKGYLETMADHPELDAETRAQFLSRALSHMNRLCNLLNDLSTMTRLDNGQESIVIESINLYNLVANIQNELTPMGLDKKLQFINALPTDCQVLGNNNLLYGMLTNLIRNADTYSCGDECGIKQIDSDEKFFTFLFYDNGIGVASEHLDRLFERFYRIDKGRSRRTGGTGLGLPIVQSTVHSLGGTIKVQNHDPHGLEYIFTLVRGDRK